MTGDKFKAYIDSTIVPLIKGAMESFIMDYDNHVVMVLCKSKICIQFEYEPNGFFNWYVSSYGVDFDDISRSDYMFSSFVDDDSYISEKVDMESLIDIDGRDNKLLFAKVYDHANNIRKLVKTKKWYDKDGYISVKKYFSEIWELKQEFYKQQ